MDPANHEQPADASPTPAGPEVETGPQALKVSAIFTLGMVAGGIVVNLIAWCSLHVTVRW